jgi:DNA cross-link repair 1A protein
MDANHCPGAVVILFKFDNGNYNFNNNIFYLLIYLLLIVLFLGRKVLHTGDFRWNVNSLTTSPTYRSLFQCSNASNLKLLTVYLDTTYCNPIHKFPLQIEAIENILSCVRKENKTHSEPLFVFGAYGIGKEKVYMSVAKELNKKVYVDKTRYKMMLCYEWPTGNKLLLLLYFID